MAEVRNRLTEEEKAELAYFEQFFNRIGFKRLDGAIWGLLAISDGPLTQEQIESVLNYSQSAISLSLKSLDHYGAIESRDIKDERDRRVKVYGAKEDALTIVASVFKKREEENIVEFRKACQRLLDRRADSDDSISKRRLTSLVSACQIAESVIDFVIKASDNKGHEFYHRIVKKLPQTFELLLKNTDPLAGNIIDSAGVVASDIGGLMKKGLRGGIAKLMQEKENYKTERQR